MYGSLHICFKIFRMLNCSYSHTDVMRAPDKINVPN